MSVVDHEIHQTSQWFQAIYQAAKKRNQESLKELIESGVCVDIHSYGSSGLQTPAYLLAKEGDVAAVNLLMELGANKNWIAQGYAEGSHINEAELYREKYNVDVDRIAFGFAIAKNHEKVEEYRQKYLASADLIAKGYAISNVKDKVVHYQSTYQANVTSIVKGFIIAGQEEEVEKYIGQYECNYNEIAKAYAIAGNTEKVKFYKEKYQVDAGDIAEGFAIGGHLKQAQSYCKEYEANETRVAIGLALGGHFDELDSFLVDRKINLNYVAKALAYAGHHEEADNFYRTRSTATMKINPAYIAAGYALSGNVMMLEKSCLKYSLAANEDFAKSLVNSDVFKNNIDLVKKELFGLSNQSFTFDLVQSLSKVMILTFDAKQLTQELLALKNIKLKYNLNFDQAVAWSKPEVRTWLLQGVQLVREGQLSKDNFFEVLSHLTPISRKDAEDLYHKAAMDVQFRRQQGAFVKPVAGNKKVAEKANDKVEVSTASNNKPEKGDEKNFLKKFAKKSKEIIVNKFEFKKK